MNNSRFFLRLLTSLLLTLSIAGCAGGKTYESTGEYFDDVAITSKVKTSILGDGKLRFFQIDVTTFKEFVLGYNHKLGLCILPFALGVLAVLGSPFHKIHLYCPNL